MPNTSAPKQVTAPLLKWPGGKRHLIRNLEDYLPKHFNRYFEPFCGGAALYFALLPDAAYLSDSNHELIEFYNTVAQNPEGVISAGGKLHNTEADYYRVRNSRPKHPEDRAARFLYLNRLAFNGIYRVNLRGEFNVPYGFKTHLQPLDVNQILKASQLLRRASFVCRGFEQISTFAGGGDLIYFDPPYTLAHSNNGFVKYNQTLFSWHDQEKLAAIAKRLARRKCFVVVSNASHATITKLYDGFKEITINRTSRIAANKLARTQVTESLFVSW